MTPMSTVETPDLPAPEVGLEEGALPDALPEAAAPTAEEEVEDESLPVAMTLEMSCGTMYGPVALLMSTAPVVSMTSGLAARKVRVYITFSAIRAIWSEVMLPMLIALPHMAAPELLDVKFCWYAAMAAMLELYNFINNTNDRDNTTITHVHDHRRHRVHDRGVSRERARRVDDTEHALLAMSRDTAVEERRVGVVDDLGEGEALVLDTRCEGAVLSLVANAELG